MNPRTLIEHTMSLHIPGSNPTTPKSINRIGCKKGPATLHFAGSTWVKRKYFSAHKTMARTTKKGRKLLMKSF
jgi:hypothetical protein